MMPLMPATRPCISTKAATAAPISSPPANELQGVKCAQSMVMLGELVAVVELRIPVFAAPFRREIEDVPQRPDDIHVARVLARIGRSEQEFGCVEVADCAIAPHEDIQHRPLCPL